jgi:hypothetical protein
MPAETAADAPPVEKPKQRLSFALVGQVGAVVGLVAAVVGLLFTFAPGLRPEKAEDPTATIANLDVNDRATMREYLSAEHIPTGQLSPAVLAWPGALTTIRYTSTGLEGKQLLLYVSLTDRGTGRIACEHTHHLAAGKGGQLTFRAWTPFPAKRATEYNLHATLFRPGKEREELDAKDHNGIPAPPAQAPPANAGAALSPFC